MTGLTPLRVPPPFDAWLVDLTTPALVDDRCLSTHERTRAARFVFAADRRRYVAAHHALRALLGARIGVDPASVALVDDDFGKPRLRDAATWGFNLSHSADVALVGFAQGLEVGVDVEVVRHLPDAVDLARHHFTEAERRDWMNAPAMQRDLMFLLAWTRKEACLKAIGSGLNVALDTVDAGARFEQRSVSIAHDGAAHAVQVCSFEPISGVVASLAYTRPDT